MARMKKESLHKRIKELEKENASLKLEINNLNAKVTYYSNLERQAGAIFNGCASWINGFIQPPQDANK